MAIIKVACPKCGQKVSGDETFAGARVVCPICSSDIHFPGEARSAAPTGQLRTEAYVEEQRDVPVESSEELPDFDDVAPQASQEGSPERPEAEASGENENTGEELDVVPSPVTGAIALVASVLGVVICGVGGILFSPIAIIFGHLSQAKARRSPVQPAPGQTLGAIGMLIGYVWLIITIIVLGILVVFEAPIREMIQSRGV
ncbi:MAG: DUF4190 domain-containing protein [Verrucomicrobiales bacterium]|nr:DUF4190 domain-containing protein [Verrucomicrobiales bacterium]